MKHHGRQFFPPCDATHMSLVNVAAAGLLRLLIDAKPSDSDCQLLQFGTN